MKKLLIATHNPAKLNELRQLLIDLPLELTSLKDVGISEDIEETGTTYEENSQQKALFYAQKSGLVALSDDGGIEIAALNNAPGIHSKRWLGAESTEEELINHMQKVANELPNENRHATFKVTLSLASPKGNVLSVTGEIKGIIAKEPFIQQRKGYPYRSFFFLPQIGKYYFESELTAEEQKKYNHRVIAIEKLKPLLRQELGLL
ncbi:MAG TPA: non-canonical purine NTP pyrophosphatase [Patescibacteria group bacterium]